jgi:predicted PurR-regulated permease PerM
VPNDAQNNPNNARKNARKNARSNNMPNNNMPNNNIPNNNNVPILNNNVVPQMSLPAGTTTENTLLTIILTLLFAFLFVCFLTKNGERPLREIFH